MEHTSGEYKNSMSSSLVGYANGFPMKLILLVVCVIAGVAFLLMVNRKQNTNYRHLHPTVNDLAKASKTPSPTKRNNQNIVEIE